MSDIGNDGTVAVQPAGFIHRAKPTPNFKTVYHISPLLLHLRPFLFRMIDWEKFGVLPSLSVVEDRACAVLERNGPGERERYYLDPEKEYAVFRYELRTNDQIQFEEDTTYKPDALCGWLPATWSATRYSLEDQRVRSGGRAILMKSELNPTVSSDELEIKFPTNTAVNDRINGIRYIMTADGGRRVITREESARNPSWDELVNSKSGMAGLGRDK